MMVKILDHITDGWVLYDNISRVHTGKVREYKYNMSTKEYLWDVDNRPDSEDNRYLTMAYHTERIAANADYAIANDQVFQFSRLFCTMNDGSVISLLFDTAAYIMNDEGKTVEKVVLNQ